MPVPAPNRKMRWPSDVKAALAVPWNERALGWREAVLRELDPLEPAAFAIRREPFSKAERAARDVDLDAIAAEVMGLPAPSNDAFHVESEAPSALSALAELSYDIAAECVVCCAAIERPRVLDRQGLTRAHFFDPALAELFATCERLHIKEGYERPLDRLPAAFSPRSWWALRWDEEAEGIFNAIRRCVHGDPVEAAQIVIEMARGRGIA
jgi:hypothetical protein